MIKAVIFDMDGVLIDAREWHYQALNKALRLFGLEISLAKFQPSETWLCLGRCYICGILH